MAAATVCRAGTSEPLPAETVEGPAIDILLAMLNVHMMRESA